MKIPKLKFARSIRYQLPLSYAVISMFAAAALGLILILVLRGYYLRREMDYLKEQTEVVTVISRTTLEAGIPLDTLRFQLEKLSFLSQTKITIYDTNGLPVIETEIPGYIADEEILNSLVEDAASETLSGAGNDSVIIRIEGNEESNSGSESEQTMLSYLNFDFGLTQITSGEVRRSDQSVHRDFAGSGGLPLGSVRISHGPAYGRDIIRTVTRSWLLAGFSAVLLSLLTGLLISRRISSPLLELTRVTSDMADGDLSVRTDITSGNELGTLGSSFNTMADSIEKTVEDLRHFVSDAAHELQTPVTALKTNLEIADRHRNSELQIRSVKAAIGQVDRLERLINNLLDLYRIEANMEREYRDIIELNSFLQGVCEYHASRAEQKDVDFNLNLPEERIMIRGNESLLEQVFINLLDNADKFTNEGGNITVSLSSMQAKALISIEDSGIGIPEEDMPVLFSRFHRGRNASKFQGNGLGLVIAKTIIQRHMGSIRAESLRTGTRFIIELPLVHQK